MPPPPAESAAPTRVFVSSVIEDFSDFRAAARKGIEAAGSQPVLVNEDFPSSPVSSRNACLDAIESCDQFALILGARGGWTAPSGRLVTEEELNYAIKRNRPVLAFVQDIERDADAQRLVTRISDYVDGNFRTTFQTPDDLRQQVERAFRALPAEASARRIVNPDLTEHFPAQRENGSTTTLRFVLIPERQEEIVDPVRLSSPAFANQIFEIGHRPEIGLLDYAHPKSKRVEGTDLIVEQSDSSGRHSDGARVLVQIGESGKLVIEASVTGRVQRGDNFSLTSSMVIALEDIESVLALCFSFADALFGSLDAYKRHGRFFYDVQLRELGHRVLERNPQSRSQFGVNMRGTDAVMAHDQFRIIARAALKEPREEIARTVELLVRKTATF